MRTRQTSWSEASGWNAFGDANPAPDLVLLFGSRAVFEAGTALDALAHHAPRERFFGCSTAGEIDGAEVHDGSMAATWVWFEKGCSVVSAEVKLADAADAEALGKLLASRLATADLKHAFVLSDGTQVNGSALVRGLRAGLPAAVTFSGGLSGDGADMKKTVVCHRGVVSTGMISLIGFSGPMDVGIGSLGGWDAFGPTRVITRAEGNVLYELDGEPALALYKRYLGEHAAALPSSALLFPLLVRETPDATPVVRTILGVDEEKGSLTFAGDVPTGSKAQLMRANFDRIIDAGGGAAKASGTGKPAELAVLVSCVGRKLILKQRVEEEVDAVRAVLGPQAVTTGFYSYGELAPSHAGAPCQLHNQTMTVTTFAEH